VVTRDPEMAKSFGGMSNAVGYYLTGKSQIVSVQPLLRSMSSNVYIPGCVFSYMCFAVYPVSGNICLRFLIYIPHIAINYPFQGFPG
jgi:hypothetical protein